MGLALELGAVAHSVERSAILDAVSVDCLNSHLVGQASELTTEAAGKAAVVACEAAADDGNAACAHCGIGVVDRSCKAAGILGTLDCAQAVAAFYLATAAAGKAAHGAMALHLSSGVAIINIAGAVAH